MPSTLASRLLGSLSLAAATAFALTGCVGSNASLGMQGTAICELDTDCCPAGLKSCPMVCSEGLCVKGTGRGSSGADGGIVPPPPSSDGGVAPPPPPPPPPPGSTTVPSVLCKSCKSNSDCGPGGFCFGDGPTGTGSATFCGLDCTSAGCPTGTTCYQVTDSTGAVVGSNCWPTAGYCAGFAGAGDCTSTTQCPTGSKCDTGTMTCQSTTTGCSGGLTSCGGACVSTTTDSSNCGSCGHVCGSGTTCSGGSCVTSSGGCSGGTTMCGSSCVNLSSDNSNCGACGNVCGSGTSCSGGTCVTSSCSSGLTLCSGSCVDTKNDTSNCGSCGHVCASGDSCNSGTCTNPCAGYAWSPQGQNYMDSYCDGCHGNYSTASGSRADASRINAYVKDGAMPPAGDPQPTSAENTAFLNWLNSSCP